MICLTTVRNDRCGSKRAGILIPFMTCNLVYLILCDAVSKSDHCFNFSFLYQFRGSRGLERFLMADFAIALISNHKVSIKAEVGCSCSNICRNQNNV